MPQAVGCYKVSVALFGASAITFAALGLAQPAGAPSPLTATPDRSHWPTGLRNVPLERLSSGALLRLDAGGNLVELPSARLARMNARALAGVEVPAVALDPRVAANIRLGDDPAALPPNMRAQAEPHIMRAPGNADYLVATFQEGRFTDGSAVDCGYSVSRDGGLSWTRSLIPGLTPSSGGPYARATDPVAGVAATGDAYLNVLTTNAAGQGVVLVSRSTDGVNFNQPRVAYQPPTGNEFADKNWMAINTFPGTATAGRIVVTFTLFPPGEAGFYPIWRVLSDDAGETWSAAAPIHSTNRQVQGSQPVFLRDGRLAVIYWNFNNTTNQSDDFLEMVLSNDGGVSFGAPRLITPVSFYDAPAMRDGGFLPSATTDRTTGTLYLAYQARQNGVPRIMFTKSANAGTTWTTPVAISDNPGSSVFNAAITASADGRKLAVAFYDTRDNPGSNTGLDIYVAYSFDGGNTWQPNLRVSSVSTDGTLAPLTSGGYMLGDYQGIADPTNLTTPAVPVWVDTRTGNPDPFTARVSILPPSTKGDFSIDGQPDLLWENNNDGQRGFWEMNRTNYVQSRFFPPVSTDWRIAGTGDFNGDFQQDIVWQNRVTGERGIWFMNDGNLASIQFLPTIPLEWEIATTGDFNQDGQTDLVWQNTVTGERGVWLMNGTTLAQVVFLPTIPLEWRIVGAADFTGDGQTDLLWENTVTGQRGVWRMNGTTFAEAIFLPSAPTEWRIAGTGDFNGDGFVDLIWQNSTTGERGFWFMNGTTMVGFSFLPTVPLEWEIANH